MGENKEFDNKKFKELIDKSKDLMKDYLRRDSSELNLLNVIDEDTYEWNHSKILNTLFTKIHIKNEKDNFLTLFLKKIGIENIGEDEVSVEREYRCIPYGQMDFKFENKNLCIVLEMKIYAIDGLKQLRKYEEFCLKNRKDYKIFYLTLDGHKPNEESVKGFKNKNNLKYISFKEHILPWLEECLNLVKNEKNKSSFILQYIAVIENLIEEEKYKMAGLIEKTEDAKAIVFLYEKILKNKMQEILENFLANLGKKIKKSLRGIDYKELKNELYNKSTLNYFLDDVEKKYYFNFGISTNKDGKIIGSFEFLEYNETEDFYYWIAFEEMKKINKDFFYKWNEKIENLENLLENFKMKNVKNDKSGYKYFYLRNRNAEEIDFKDFSKTSIALNLIDNMDKEVDYFSKIFIEIIRKLKNV